jgi:hypothetical protein
MTAPANQLPLSTVISISASQTPTGVGQLNKSNLAILTRDLPNTGTFGTLGYQIYFTPTQVGVDFGTSSYTYKMALAVFGQTKNILSPGGYLVVIPMIAGTAAIQTLALSGVAASGSFVLNYSGTYGGATVAINWNDTAAVIQSKLQAIEDLRSCTVTGSISSESLVVTMVSVNGVAPALTVTANTLETSAPAAITFTITTTTPGVAGEPVAAALARTTNVVQYFGVIVCEYVVQADMLASAAVIQAATKIIGIGSTFAADVAVGGYLALIQSEAFTQTRGLYYSGPTMLSMLQFVAGYMSILLSTNFAGSNTTQTMNLQQISGVVADPNITNSIWELAQAAGADTYVSYQGYQAVSSTGTNKLADQVYNLLAFSSDLQVAGFNYLAQAGTKVPQTEAGMSGYKSALRVVCEQYVSNQYLAPGTWTSPSTFGNQVAFQNNITQRGYYIYSSPISQQNPAQRVARDATLVQIAGKQAGAIQSGAIIVSINP